MKVVNDDLESIKKCFRHCLNYFDKGTKVLKYNLEYYNGVDIFEEPDNVTTKQLYEIIDNTSTEMNEFIANYRKRMDKLHVVLKNIYNDRTKLVNKQN